MNGSNIYGYTGYHGPKLTRAITGESAEFCQQSPLRPKNRNLVTAEVGAFTIEDNGSESDSEHNPLQVGFWMEGDSLAPPCGSSIPTIHSLLEFAGVTEADILYDLGCGDARVCLEAYARYNCRSFGVEVEEDLAERASTLISNLAERVDDQRRLPRVIRNDLRDVLSALVAKASLNCNKRGLGSKSLTAKSNDAGLQLRQLDDLSLPTLIVLYLLPDAIEIIEEDLLILLRILPDNFRIVCNTWGIKSLRKVKSMEVREQSLALTPLYLYSKESFLPP